MSFFLVLLCGKRNWMAVCRTSRPTTPDRSMASIPSSHICICLFTHSFIILALVIPYAAGLSLERPSCLMGEPFVWRYLTAPDGHRLWINKQRPTMPERTINSTCQRERRRMSERGADWFAWARCSTETRSPSIVELARNVTQQCREREVSHSRVLKSQRFTSWQAFWQLELK